MEPKKIDFGQFCFYISDMKINAVDSVQIELKSENHNNSNEMINCLDYIKHYDYSRLYPESFNKHMRRISRSLKRQLIRQFIFNIYQQKTNTAGV